MSRSLAPGTRLSSVDGHGFSRDEMLDVLSNQRRRFAIHYLKRHEGDRVAVSELADRVASWENGKRVDDLSYQERKRVRNALRQFHLPKMDEHGFIDYDSQRNTLALTETASSTNFYLDSLTGGDVPWGVYYLGFSLLSAVCLVGIGANLPFFARLPPLVFGVFFVTVLVASSVGHLYDNYYRMRLGAREAPPEVENGRPPGS
jgi:hypothetical protein